MLECALVLLNIVLIVSHVGPSLTVWTSSARASSADTDALILRLLGHFRGNHGARKKKLLTAAHVLFLALLVPHTYVKV